MTSSRIIVPAHIATQTYRGGYEATVWRDAAAVRSVLTRTFRDASGVRRKATIAEGEWDSGLTDGDAYANLRRVGAWVRGEVPTLGCGWAAVEEPVWGPPSMFPRGYEERLAAVTPEPEPESEYAVATTVHTVLYTRMGVGPHSRVECLTCGWTKVLPSRRRAEHEARVHAAVRMRESAAQ